MARKRKPTARRLRQRRYDREYDARQPHRHAARSLRRRGGEVTLAEVRELFRAEPACAYCGGVPEHVDHATPLSRGGAGDLGNLVVSCKGCNLSKGTQTVLEFLGLWPSDCPF